MAKALKALLVGQQDENLDELRSMLASDELEIVATAGLGPAALTWAREVEPDLAIVVAGDSFARPIAIAQTLAQGDSSWTVVVMAERFERELVHQAMLAGARDVLLRTSTPTELRQALLTARRAHLAQRKSAGQEQTSAAGTIISLVGVKGGIGKTTTSVNLAVALAQETGRSVALVDLDLPFGDLAMLLDLQPQGSVVAALNDPSILADPDLLQRQLCVGPAGVQVLPAPIGGNAKDIDSSQISLLLSRLAGLYDFVVVDTPGGFGEYTAASLDVATYTLLLTTPEGPTLRRSELGLRQLAIWNYPSNKLKVVLNRTNLKTGITEEEVTSILSQPVAWWLVEEPGALRAAAMGEPIIISQPKSELARMFRQMARQLAGLPEAPQRSFWATLLRRKPELVLARAS